MSKEKKRASKKEFENLYPLSEALTKGGPIIWLSCLIMGLGNILAGQIVKGLLFLAIEVAVIVYMVLPTGGIHWLSLLPSLGDRLTEEIWNDAKGVYEYVIGDNSQQILLYAVATMAIVVFFAVIWSSSVRSGWKAQSLKKAGKHVPTIMDDIKGLFDENIHKLLMTPPFLTLTIFTIIPLVYMMLMAFTNYSQVDSHLILFDWVGL